MNPGKRLRYLVAIGLFGVLAPALAARGQTIVVTAKSASELASDLEALIKSVDPEDPQGQAILDGIKQFKEGAILKGFDRTRGFGVAVTLPRNFPQESPTIVAAVPVTDLGQFLNSLKDLGLAVDDQPGAPGFSHKVSTPDGSQSLYVLQSKGYALFSLVPGGADRLKALDISSWWKKHRPETVLSAKIHLAEIPPALKDQFIAGFEAQAQNDREKKADESEAEYRGRLAGQDLAVAGVKAFVNQGDTLAFDLDYDRKAGELAIDLAVSGQPGTAMAKDLRAFGAMRSRFQGLDRDANAALSARFPLSKELGESFARILDDGVKANEGRLKNDGEKEVFRRFNDLIKSALKAPDLDLGLSIRRGKKAGGGDSKFLMEFGISLPDSAAAERLARDAVKKFELEKGFTINFDVAKTANGTAIHRMNVPYDEKDREDEYLLKTFGKASLSFAFPRGALVAAFGEDAEEPLRRLVAELSGPRPAGGIDGPAAATVRLAGLADMADTDRERDQFRKAAENAFKGKDAKRDRAALVIKGTDTGIRIRLAIDGPALRMLAELGDDDNDK